MQHKNELEVLVKNGTKSVYCIQYCYLIFDTWNYLNLFFSCKSRSLHLPIYPLIQYQLSKILFKSLVWNLEWNSTFIQSVKNKMQTQTPQWHFQNLLLKRKETNNCWSWFNRKVLTYEDLIKVTDDGFAKRI